MDSGFKASHIPSEAGQFELHARKGKEMWHIILKPHSPLASYLKAEYTLDGLPDHERTMQLLRHVSDYRRSVNGGSPRAVLSHIENIVCIKAGTEDADIQFSGFIIGNEGLIISTAHDLDTVRNVAVTLINGEKLVGRVISLDFDRDLSLIDIDKSVRSSISLEKARNLLVSGETVYSIICSTNRQGRIESGIIDSPMRIADSYPLWQVNMDTPPGSSGSPVFDAGGNLVGVVRGRYRGTGRTGFLITAETVLEFLRNE
jgi:serine protease Do